MKNVLRVLFLLPIFAAPVWAADSAAPAPAAIQPPAAPPASAAREALPPIVKLDRGLVDYFDSLGMVLIDSDVVKEVLKSDMIMLDNNRRYRLENIRIPPYGDTEAFEELKKILLGKRVSVFSYHDVTQIDRYGLPLAHVVRQEDSLWAQSEMVARGRAWAFSTVDGIETVDVLKVAEEKAREQELGFWSVPAYKVKSPEGLVDFIDTFQVVEGRIESVAVNPRGIFFNFGKDWKTDFTVRAIGGIKLLYPELYQASKRGHGVEPPDPRTWKGRKIRVRGWVTENNGPMIEIDHLQQMDILEIPPAEKKGDKAKPAAETPPAPAQAPAASPAP